MVDIVLCEGRHWLRSFPQRQVAVVGLTDHKVVQLLWRGVMILYLDMSIECIGLSSFSYFIKACERNGLYIILQLRL